MCDCKTTIPKEAERKCERLAGRDVDFSEIERYGYSIIRIGHRKYDGQPSKTFLYPGVDWSFCPFCGEQI
ncbi:unnamed protein product [marine sediment metagenome]|uniref:Uncharacterized protein n=1 Tax=marine sediment metagenome TaxID=412755 RepID=X1HRC1_9ZZZZ